MSEQERKAALRRLYRIIDKREVSPRSRERIARASVEEINELIAELEKQIAKAVNDVVYNSGTKPKS